MEAQQERPVHFFWQFGAPNSRSKDTTAVVKAQVLCRCCKSIKVWLRDWESLKSADRTKGILARSGMSERLTEFQHHGTGAALEASYRAGCHLCTLMWHAVVDNSIVIDGTFKTWLTPKGESKRRKLWQRIQQSGVVTITAQRTVGRVVRELSLYIDVAISPDRAFGTVGLHELGESEKANADEMPTVARPLPISTSSPDCVGLIRKWMLQCLGSHQECSQHVATNLPRRLLRLVVRNGFSLQLIETSSLPDGTKPKYACLSYCWGGSSGFKLVQSTQRELADGISLARLPKTIRDAAVTAHQLGLEWLWVDSLCIIQDSKEDWKREAAEMCDVYQGCFVCIAALGATTNESGLFTQRDPLMYSHCLIDRPEGRSSIYASSGQTSDPYSEQKWPLCTRGWAKQERVLPPRTVKFGPLLQWECRHVEKDEFGTWATWSVLGSNPPAPHVPDTAKLYQALIAPAVLKMPVQADKIHDMWRTTLESFTDTSLTYVSDRLIAISGIMTIIQRSTGWENLAGLWLPFIDSEILWSRPSGNGSRRSNRTGLLPTWSWVSVTGRISPMSRGLKEPLWLVRPDRRSKEPSVVSDGAYNDPLCIHIRAIPLKLTLEQTPRVHMSVIWNGYIRKFAGLPEMGEFYIHYDADPFDLRVHYFLPASIFDNDGKLFPIIHGIVVALSKVHHGMFERVAWGEWVPECKKAEAHRFLNEECGSRPTWHTLV
jgi:Heterokaryon incompatibility protein (HET)